MIASVATEQIELTQESLQSTLGSGYIAMAFIEAVPAKMYGKAGLEALDFWANVQGQVWLTNRCHPWIPSAKQTSCRTSKCCEIK